MCLCGLSVCKRVECSVVSWNEKEKKKNFSAKENVELSKLVNLSCYKNMNNLL